MPSTVPSATDLAARFPVFAVVPAPILANAIAEAQGRVDASWLPDDYGIALMLLAAHTLTLDGLGSGAEAAAAGAQGFTSLRSGSLGLVRDAAPTGPNASPLQATSYGRRFLALLRVNQPAVLVP